VTHAPSFACLLYMVFKLLVPEEKRFCNMQLCNIPQNLSVLLLNWSRSPVHYPWLLPLYHGMLKQVPGLLMQEGHELLAPRACIKTRLNRYHDRDKTTVLFTFRTKQHSNIPLKYHRWIWVPRIQLEILVSPLPICTLGPWTCDASYF